EANAQIQSILIPPGLAPVTLNAVVILPQYAAEGPAGILGSGSRPIAGGHQQIKELLQELFAIGITLVKGLEGKSFDFTVPSLGLKPNVGLGIRVGLIRQEMDRDPILPLEILQLGRWPL